MSKYRLNIPKKYVWNKKTIKITKDKKMKIIKLFIACLIIGVLAIFRCSDSSSNPTEINEISIGALIPLSGDYANQGQEILAALNCAVEDINSEFENNNKMTRINLITSDTETDSNIAKVQMESYIDQDIRITIGPLTSVEVKAVKDDIDASNNLLISPSSTLTSLSIVEDNIFRFVPDDAKTVEATVEVMWDRGIRNLAMFYVDNAWGQGFVTLIQEQFEAKGGTYIGDVAFIGSRESELQEYLNELSAIIDPIVSAVDPSTVAVQMICLDVGSFLLELASADTSLRKVKWFGCDGYVNTDELFLYYDEGTEFAEHVEFTSPIFGSPSTNKSQALVDRIFSVTNSTPGAYSLLTYDALTVAAKVLEETGENATITELKEKLISMCATHSGITGNIILNDAGDRTNGSYFFWKIVADGNTHKWEHVITYTDGVISVP
jgi:branched-chain amino acid transport system substrate-binding protein